MTSGIDVKILADASSAILLLTRLEVALSAPGVAVFLETNVKQLIQERAQARFNSQGDDVSGVWKKLTDATVSIRESQGFGPTPINIRTTDLERFITTSAGQIIGDTLVYPGDAPTRALEQKVMTAQQGRTFPETPARPVLGLNETDALGILTDLALYIQAAGVGI